MRKIQRVRAGAGGGGSVAAPLSITILGGQFFDDDTDLPYMRYSTDENKFSTAPAGWVAATVTVTASGGVLSSVTVDAGGSWHLASNTNIVVPGGDGAGRISLTATSGVVTSGSVTTAGTGYPDSTTFTVGATGTPQGLPFPDGYGYGILSNGSRTIISYWGSRNFAPQWPAGANRTMNWVENVTETATDNTTFTSARVISRF
jgi:hypothetical protein